MPIVKRLAEVQKSIALVDHLNAMTVQSSVTLGGSSLCLDDSDGKGDAKDSGPTMELADGQLARVPLSLGRKDAVLGLLEMGKETYLNEVRQQVEEKGWTKEEYRFLSSQEQVIPLEEESLRRPLYDCSIPLRMRPTSWRSI
ncbi:unnamed protein product [Chrysoparadoxa australica]